MALRLPDVADLKHVQMQVPLRIYTSDGKLIGVYGEKRRIPVTFKQVPKLLIDGLIATEDQRFYEHPGVDVLGTDSVIFLAANARKWAQIIHLPYQYAHFFINFIKHRANKTHCVITQCVILC